MKFIVNILYPLIIPQYFLSTIWKTPNSSGKEMQLYVYLHFKNKNFLTGFSCVFITLDDDFQNLITESKEL